VKGNNISGRIFISIDQILKKNYLVSINLKKNETMNIYKSTKNTFFLILVKYVPYTLYSIMLLSLIQEYITSEGANNRLIISIVILSIMFVLLIAFVEKTLKINYRIEGSILHIDSGFTKREIQISNIQSLMHSNYMGYGRKPGLDIKGLKIMYESGRMMYITPERSEEFIIKLKSVNQKIIIQ